MNYAGIKGLAKNNKNSIPLGFAFSMSSPNVRIRAWDTN